MLGSQPGLFAKTTTLKLKYKDFLQSLVALLFTDPFPCILLRLWIRWCYIHTDMGGGDRKRRAIHFKTFKSLHVIFLFCKQKRQVEAMFVLAQFRIHLALSQKSLYSLVPIIRPVQIADPMGFQVKN